ncbi:TRAP transporter small permease subunit [Desulfocurvus sp. DL9XJH121]
MRTIIRFIEGLSAGGALLSSLGMVFIVGLILLETVLRAFFNTSTLVASEYGGYALVGLVLFGLSYTMRENGFIRITLLYIHLPRRARRVADILCGLAACALTAFLLFFSVQMVYETWGLEMTADSISETPLWIPQLFIPLGLLLFLLQCAAYVAKRLLDDK